MKVSVEISALYKEPYRNIIIHLLPDRNDC